MNHGITNDQLLQAADTGRWTLGLTEHNAGACSVAEDGAFRAAMHQEAQREATAVAALRVFTQAEWNRLLGEIIVTLGDIGTSEQTFVEGSRHYRINVEGSCGGVVLAFALRTLAHAGLSAVPGITLRQWARHHADFLWKYGKRRSYWFRVGREHGVPQQFGYLGFDFVDGLHLVRPSNQEQNAILRAKREGLFWSAESSPPGNVGLAFGDQDWRNFDLTSGARTRDR